MALGSMLFLLPVTAGATETPATESQPPRIVRTLSDWWQAAQGPNPAPITLDVVADVTFFDPHWKNFWVLEPQGSGSYLAITGRVPAIKVGQRVRLHGTFVPTPRLSTSDVEVTILDDGRPLIVMPTTGDVMNVDRFQHRTVRMAGVVEAQEVVDPHHVRLHLISEGHWVEVIVLVGASDRVPTLPGFHVVVEGLYAPRYTSSGMTDGIAVWVPDIRGVHPGPPLAEDDRLTLPLQRVADFQEVPFPTWVRVEGMLQDVHPGRSFVLESGGRQLFAQTGQRLLPAAGQHVEVIGRLEQVQGRLLLTEALVPRGVVEAQAPTRLTSFSQWWQARNRDPGRPLPFEATAEVSFFDPGWNNLWVISEGDGYYVSLAGRSFDLKVGDRIRVAGSIIPGQNISADSLEITVLERGGRPQPPEIRGHVAVLDRWRNRWVRLEGYVESQERVDDSHLRLQLLAEDLRIETLLLIDGTATPDLAGNIVRIDGIYVPVNAPDGTLAGLTLNVQGLDQLEVLGPLPADARFQLPLTTTDQAALRAPGDWVRLEGVVQDQAPGASLVLRDPRGQIFAHNVQQGRLEHHDPVELVGRIAHEDGRIVLRETLFRPLDPSANTLRQVDVEDLRAAAQVIALPPMEAERQLPVRLSGVVTWSHPSSRTVYLLDASRGVRVQLADGLPVPVVGRGLVVDGVTAPGAFASEVRAHSITEPNLLQYLSMPEPQAISLEQAMTGLEEARWIELSGYVRAVEADGPWSRLSLLTAGGEFRARLPRADSHGRLRGAFVRVQGVCTALANDRRQLTGIELLAPTARSVQIEHPAPADPFALPLQSLASLQQFNILQSSHRLARISATVLHHLPGRLLYAADSGQGIRILSTETASLAPGDRVEAVGLPGRENSQLVLREAVYRRTGHAAEPAATPLLGDNALQEDLDGRLVQLEATLLGAIAQGQDLRLMLQRGATAFDALLPAAPAAPGWLPGSRLELTGVYELVRDEYRAPRSLQLQLRAADDVRVVRQPSWWTPERALGFSGSLALVLLLGLGWVRALRQRVRSQTREISSQLAKVAHLEARHRGIIESASDFIFTASIDGMLTSINPAGERLLGYTREQALALNIRDLVAPEDQAAGRAMLDLQAQADGTATFQCRFRRRNGELVWVETSARLLQENGRATGLLGVVRDSTARRLHEEALTQARDAAEASARAKSTFLANMSHEIRTPMNGVIGMSNLLLDTQLDPQQHEFAETIRNSAESLLTVLNDILDFSKIEAGKLQFEVVDFDLNESVESTLELMSARATVKKLELAAFVPVEVPVAVRGDPGRLRQVLLNLLGNAIKFTDEGEVVIRLAVVEQDAGSARIRFEVRDTGIGLTAEAQGELFQPFVQADSSTTRRFGGTGLGLAICRQIIELMGGEIGVTSAPGRGSTFWFTVPFTKSDASVSRATAGGDAASCPLRGLRIAIVDDNATNRCLLEHYVRGWGGHSQSFASGAEALRGLRAAAAAGTPFAVALLDFQMPEMDGLMLAEKIQADPVLQGTRRLLLTSIDHRFEPDVLQARGIRHMMTKPIRRNDLCAAIRSAARIEAAPERAERRAPAQADRLPAGPVLRVLVAEDNVVNQRVARLQLEKLGHRVDLVANGLEVLEAVERAPYDLILMDCQMPEMDGYEATRRIRQSGSQPDIVIVAMTAHAMEGDREACLAAGMNDYLSKPVRMPMLEAVLEQVAPALAARRQRRAASGSVAG